MNYTFEKDGGVVKISFTVNSEEWEKYIDRAYEQVKGGFNIKGFRKGMAPKKVLESMYGKSVFFEDAFELCFRDSYGEFLEKEKFDPILDPEVELEKISEDGVVFSAEAVLHPVVTLKAYTGLEIKQQKLEVCDHEVQHEIDRVRERTSRRVSVDTRAILEGDIVNFDFTGFLDGEKFDGGAATDFELEIGSGRFIPGFEEQMIGLRGGEEADLKVTFPEDYQEPKLAGKPTVFHVKINQIFVKELPAMDDDFAKDVSEFNTFAEYKDSVAAKILLDKTSRIRAENENALIDAVVENMEADVPEKLIDHEVDMMVRDFEQRLSAQNLKLEDYLSYLGTNLEDFKKDRREEALRQIRTRLSIEALIEAEKLSATDEEIEAAIEKEACAAGKTPDQFKRTLDRRTINGIINGIVIDKLLAFLRDNNTLIEAGHGHGDCGCGDDCDCGDDCGCGHDHGADGHGHADKKPAKKPAKKKGKE